MLYGMHRVCAIKHIPGNFIVSIIAHSLKEIGTESLQHRIQRKIYACLLQEENVNLQKTFYNAKRLKMGALRIYAGC